MSKGTVFNAAEADFQETVVERSDEVPVIVDFWAEWCGPCRQLGPALEAAVKKRGGAVELAKVDVDANPRLAQAFEVQGIPAVKAIRGRTIVGEFTGALPPAKLDEFLDAIMPSQAEQLVEAGGEENLRKALELEPTFQRAALELSRIMLKRGEGAEVAELLAKFPNEFHSDGLRARATLLAEGAVDQRLEAAFTAWDDGEYAAALDGLQEQLTDAAGDNDRIESLRLMMVTIFAELGADHPLAREHRPRLAAALP